MNTKLLSIGACFLFFFTAKAQSDSLLLNLDFRTRAEMDNGQKTLIPKGKQPETSVYSRARLGIDYHREHLELMPLCKMPEYGVKQAVPIKEVEVLMFMKLGLNISLMKKLV